MRISGCCFWYVDRSIFDHRFPCLGLRCVDIWNGDMSPPEMCSLLSELRYALVPLSAYPRKTDVFFRDLPVFNIKYTIPVSHVFLSAWVFLFFRYYLSHENLYFNVVSTWLWLGHSCMYFIHLFCLFIHWKWSRFSLFLCPPTTDYVQP